MKVINNIVKPRVHETIYECESFHFKIKMVFDSITKMSFIYIVPGSGKQYAVTEECANDIIMSMMEEKV